MATEMQKWIRRTQELESIVKGLSGGTQLDKSSLENGAINEYDDRGDIVASYGKQHDGSHVAVPFVGPVPPVPAAAKCVGGPGVLEVRTSGKFEANAVSTLDWSHFAVYVSDDPDFTPDFTSQEATLRGELGDVALFAKDAGTYYVRLASWSKTGRHSEASVPAEVVVPIAADMDAVQDALDAMDLSISEVQESVNGVNKIQNATSEPVGDGATTGDRWQRWDTLGEGGKLLKAWRWDGNVWLAESMDASYLPRVDIGAGTFGDLDGERLTADSVSVRALRVGDFTNLIREPRFTSGGSEWEGTPNFGVVPTGGIDGGPAGRLEGNGEYQAIVQKPPGIPCEEGDAFRISAWYKPSVDLSWLYMSFYAKFELAGGDFELDLAWAKTVYAGEWGETYGIVTAPEGTVSVSFGFGVKANVDPGEEILFDRVNVFRAATGELIVDGAFDARTITAPKIQSVVAPNRGLKWIEEGLIAFNSVGTETFNLSATTGEASFLGKVRSGSEIEGATITGGLLQTSPGSGGVKITNDQLEVNDESGDGGITLAPSSDSSGWDTSKAVMKFRTGSPSENRAGAFYSFSDGDTDEDRLSLQAWSPERNSHGMASLQLFSGTVQDAASVFLGGAAVDGAATLKLSGDGYAYLAAPGDLNLVAPNLNMHGDFRLYGGKIGFLGPLPGYSTNFIQSDYPVKFTANNSASTANSSVEMGFLDVRYINGWKPVKFYAGDSSSIGSLSSGGGKFNLNITYGSMGFTQKPAVLAASSNLRVTTAVSNLTKTSATINCWNGTSRDSGSTWITWNLVGE